MSVQELCMHICLRDTEEAEVFTFHYPNKM